MAVTATQFQAWLEVRAAETRRAWLTERALMTRSVENPTEFMEHALAAQSASGRLGALEEALSYFFSDED